jgi:predicted nucleic acid-binding protein
VILADTSVWIDHLRLGDERLTALLDQKSVLMHPFVLGELAVGNLRPRNAMLSLLRALPSCELAKHDEVLGFIEQNKLYGVGVGYVDAHLLVSVGLTRDAALWSRDVRLHRAAAGLGLAVHLTH